MWKIIKINKKELGLFKSDFVKKIDNDLKIYIPKIQLFKNFKNKLIKREINILGDYIFCYHKKFEEKTFMTFLKNFKGLSDILIEGVKGQDEILNFIKKCKKSEDENGYLTQEFFELNIKKNYKFLNGPFSEKIFKIINLQKNKLKVLIGNIKTTIKKKEFLFNPI